MQIHTCLCSSFSWVAITAILRLDNAMVTRVIIFPSFLLHILLYQLIDCHNEKLASLYIIERRFSNIDSCRFVLKGNLDEDLKPLSRIYLYIINPLDFDKTRDYFGFFHLIE